MRDVHLFIMCVHVGRNEVELDSSTFKLRSNVCVALENGGDN